MSRRGKAWRGQQRLGSKARARTGDPRQGMAGIGSNGGRWPGKKWRVLAATVNSQQVEVKMSRKYGFVPGRRLAVPAQVVGEALEKIEERDGSIAPGSLINEARPEYSELHPLFEWNDKVAAELHRRRQESESVRSVRTIVMDQDSGEKLTPPAFVSVTVRETDSRGYVSSAKAMSDEEYRSQVLTEALAQIAALKRRYRHLAALEPVWKALEEVSAE